MKISLIVIGVFVFLAALVWAGLWVKPAAFPPFTDKGSRLATVPLPQGLPAPVERFYLTTYGSEVPLIDTAVISGRGWMRFLGLKVPIRFRFAHEAGQNYRHDIHLTFFGVPLIKGFETYIDGRGWANMPGMKEGDGFNQGSNVSLWAETLNWFPAVLVTDPRVQWIPVDDATALLSVPFGAGQERLVVRFDPKTSQVQFIEAMKYKSAVEKKVLWMNGMWMDEGRPWIQLNVENIIYNVDVEQYIRAEKP